MHKEAYLLFFGFASSVDYEFGETEQDTIDTLVKAYNEAPEEWKPELLAAGPEYLRVAITGEKDKSMWKPFVPDPNKDPDNLYKKLQEGKHVVLIHRPTGVIYGIKQSAHTNEKYIVIMTMDGHSDVASYDYDNMLDKFKMGQLLCHSYYHEFETEKEALRFKIEKEFDMKEGQ